MCGITGIYNYKSRTPVDISLAGKMLDSIAHRGPDDSGSYFYNAMGLYLGHRRLSIIDLNSGCQPMTNEDESIWISFNGEIYNFFEIKTQLIVKGHRFKTKSDTEVIVHAYEEWGVSAFSKLNGMFAFAIYDENDATLFLVRDPFGIKPLYYFDNNASLLLLGLR